MSTYETNPSTPHDVWALFKFGNRHLLDTADWSDVVLISLATDLSFCVTYRYASSSILILRVVISTEGPGQAS